MKPYLMTVRRQAGVWTVVAVTTLARAMTAKAKVDLNSMMMISGG